MHEFSIAMSIVELAEQEARNASTAEVECIELDIGALSGVDHDALDFAWDSAVKDSVLENSEKLVNIVNGLARCRSCNKDFDIDEVFDPCPHCGSYSKEILQGKELTIRRLVLN